MSNRVTHHEPCNKTLACCRELHANETRFGSFPLAPGPGQAFWKTPDCPFSFGDEQCTAAPPTTSELRLYNLVLDVRANAEAQEAEHEDRIVQLEADLAELRGEGCGD